MVVNDCDIVEPEPSVAPDTPETKTVQEKVVPGTLLVNAIDVFPPDQNIWDVGVAVTVGIGLTITFTITGVPGHIPVIPVIV